MTMVDYIEYGQPCKNHCDYDLPLWYPEFMSMFDQVDYSWPCLNIFDNDDNVNVYQPRSTHSIMYMPLASYICFWHIGMIDHVATMFIICNIVTPFITL